MDDLIDCSVLDLVAIDKVVVDAVGSLVDDAVDDSVDEVDAIADEATDEVVND